MDAQHYRELPFASACKILDCLQRERERERAMHEGAVGAIGVLHGVCDG